MRPFKLLVIIGIVVTFLVAGHSVFAVAYADIPPESTAEPATTIPETASATLEAATATAEPTQPAATATSEPVTAVPPTATAIPNAPTATVSAPTATPGIVATATAQIVPTAPPPVPTVLSANGGPPVDRGVPLPDQPVAEAPLSLAQRISASSAYIGMEVQYTIQISGAQPGTPVEVRNVLPSELDVLSIVTSAGSCSGGSQPVCQLILGEESATIIIRARVSNRAIPGSNLIAQAAAQDNAAFTAASDPIMLAIVSAPSVAQNGEPASGAPIAAPGALGGTSNNSGTPSNPAQPAQPSTLGEAVISGQPLAIATRQDTSIANTPNGDERTNLPNGALPPIGSPGEPAILPIPIASSISENLANIPIADTSNISIAPIAAQNMPTTASGPQYAAAKLPDTAATTIVAGWFVGLLGFATIAYGLRRVRRAALLLDDQRFTQLEPLMKAMRQMMRSQ